MPGLEDLLGQMTLQEKVALLAGTNMWYTVPVERLGIQPEASPVGSSLPAFQQRFRWLQRGIRT